MSARTTRSSQRLGRAVDLSGEGSNSQSSSDINPPDSQKEKQASASGSIAVAADTDPNRRFNPDVLLTIAECLMDIKFYQSVIALSCVSRYFAESLKPFRERMRKRVILKLGNLDVAAKSGWDAVKFIECDRNSTYPIPPDLSTTEQRDLKTSIISSLKPSVIRYMGKPHECAFRLQQELFPSATVLRFIYDPFERNLVTVFPSKSTKGGESAIDLMQRMVPVSRYGRNVPPSVPHIRVVEYLKKGFEFRDLDSLPQRQIQSSIRVKAQDGFRFYRESFERYPADLGALQRILTSSYFTKNVQVSNRHDLRKVLINVYMKPSPGATSGLLSNDQDDHSLTFESIFDSLQALAQRSLSSEKSSCLRFQLWYIHGTSASPRPLQIARPDHRRYEKRTLPRQDYYYDEEDEIEDTNGWETDEDDYEDEELEVPEVEHLYPSPPQRTEEGPVFILEFTKSHGKLRATETTFDKDVLKCAANLGCPRCRGPTPT